MQAPGGFVLTTPIGTGSLGSAHLAHLPGLLGARTPGEEPGRYGESCLGGPCELGSEDGDSSLYQGATMGSHQGLSSGVDLHFKDSIVRWRCSPGDRAGDD